jgi:hypothetical protein
MLNRLTRSQTRHSDNLVSNSNTYIYKQYNTCTYMLYWRFFNIALVSSNCRQKLYIPINATEYRRGKQNSTDDTVNPI